MQGCRKWRSASGAGLQESLDLIFCQRELESVQDRAGRRNMSCCNDWSTAAAGWTRTEASAWAWPIVVAAVEANGKGFLDALVRCVSFALASTTGRTLPVSRIVGGVARGC